MKPLVKDEKQADGFAIAVLVTFGVLYSFCVNFGRIPLPTEVVLGLGYLIAASHFLPEPVRNWVIKAWWFAASAASVPTLALLSQREPTLSGLGGAIRFVLVVGFLPVYFMLEAVGIKGRDQTIWLYRAACVGVVAAMEDKLTVVTALYFVVGGIAAIAGDVIIRRIIEGPPYFIDENGERQRIKGRNRGHFIYDPTTRPQRIVREYQVNKTRRRGLLVYSAMLLPILYGTGWSLGLDDATARWGLTIFLCLIGFGPAIGVLSCTFQEFIYQTGYQGMDGAKVLDPVAGQPAGLDEVLRQKAYGDPRIPTENEALAQLREGG